MPKKIVPNPAYDTTVSILREKGYQRIREFVAPVPRGCFPCEDHFEVWVNPPSEGVTTNLIMLQVWNDGNGVCTYTTKGMGSTFEEFSAAL